MDPNYQHSCRRLAYCIVAFAALAGPSFATLELPDRLDVGGGGLGPVIASFEAITNEVGYVVDDTFDGEITFKWTMKWNVLEEGTASGSWSLFHFFNDPEGNPVSLDNESIGIGAVWNSTKISIYKEPGSDGIIREAGKAIREDQAYDFTLVVDYHAGAPDTARISGGGFFTQPLGPGDWSFHHIRARVGSNGKASTRVDFTQISITSSGRSGTRSTGQVDPPFPADWHIRRDVKASEWTRWPRTHIRQLERERERLLAKISVLPQHKPAFLSTRLGYHSQFEDSDSADSSPPHQIDFKFRWAPVLNSIALAPAFNPMEPGAYAFPKRFKIEVVDNRRGEFKEIVNWMEEDFPDPGPYPVFFSKIYRSVRQVRMTVLPQIQESGAAYFAIGEVFLFNNAPGGRLGDNMAGWPPPAVEVTASGSFSMPPLWDVRYLYDGDVGFGFPLSDQIVESSDLMVTYDEAPVSDKVQITLDLGRQKAIGRIDFWPAGAPYLLALPSLGFPREISVELSPYPDFKTVKALKVEKADGYHLESLLSVRGGSYYAQYIRITMEGLSEYKGKKILGLGEILVSEFGLTLSTNCTITAQGIPEEYMDQLPLLVDGYSRKHLILPQGEWIKGLAQRRPLDRRLAVVEKELELARVRWARIQWHFTLWGGSLIFAGLILGMVLQRRQRRRILDRLKWRITRDLHDDVGSNLGSISLTAEKLKHADMNAEVRQAINDLTLLAREAFSSLREVVWVVNESVIRLPMLIQKLGERAERVLGAERVIVEISPDCPDCIVPLTLKRHLVMLFKEMAHNCARHAQASRIWVAFSMTGEALRISVRDDGCGFDTAAPSDGWGLESMEERAQEIGGTLKVESQVGEGTTVVLMVPLASLMSEAEDLYKTSN